VAVFELDSVIPLQDDKFFLQNILEMTLWPLWVIMFIIPAFHPIAEPSQRILDWESVRDLPWGIIFLLESGFAIARAFVVTDL
jgi:di/tricarboxylate transporter